MLLKRKFLKSILKKKTIDILDFSLFSLLCVSTNTTWKMFFINFKFAIHENNNTEIICFEKWRWHVPENECHKWENAGLLFQGKV